MLYDLIIIGAGAAGLFAAANAPADRRILLLEKTDTPGKKLLLSGSGQCNLTNSGDIKDFLPRYGANGKRLRSVLYPFSNLALMAWFENHGMTLTTRPDGKVFPASLNAHDVRNLLLDQSRKNGVELRYGTSVTALTPYRGDDPSRARFTLETPTGPLTARQVLVTTGGASYPRTGSDGGFFSCLEALGLEIIPPRPGLTPVHVHNYPYSELSGISFPDCGISIKTNTNPIRAQGSLLFTHRGFSGPVVLNNARYIGQGQKLSINYLPGRDSAALRPALLTAASGAAQQIITRLEAETHLPRRFLEVICQRANIPPDTKAARLGGPEMARIAEHLTTDTYAVSGLGGFSAAMVTVGGVSLDEVNLRTMQSRNIPGLFFAGEILDADGDTGGYNLQFAFSSAKLAMDSIC